MATTVSASAPWKRKIARTAADFGASWAWTTTGTLQTRAEHRRHQDRAIGDHGVDAAAADDGGKPYRVGSRSRRVERPAGRRGAPDRRPGRPPGAIDPNSAKGLGSGPGAHGHDELVVARERSRLAQREELRAGGLGAVDGR